MACGGQVYVSVHEYMFICPYLCMYAWVVQCGVLQFPCGWRILTTDASTHTNTHTHWWRQSVDMRHSYIYTTSHLNTLPLWRSVVTWGRLCERGVNTKNFFSVFVLWLCQCVCSTWTFTFPEHQVVSKCMNNSDYFSAFTGTMKTTKHENIITQN